MPNAAKLLIFLLTLFLPDQHQRNTKWEIDFFQQFSFKRKDGMKDRIDESRFYHFIVRFQFICIFLFQDFLKGAHPIDGYEEEEVEVSGSFQLSPMSLK